MLQNNRQARTGNESFSSTQLWPSLPPKNGAHRGLRQPQKRPSPSSSGCQAHRALPTPLISAPSRLLLQVLEKRVTSPPKGFIGTMSHLGIKAQCTSVSSPSGPRALGCGASLQPGPRSRLPTASLPLAPCSPQPRSDGGPGAASHWAVHRKRERHSKHRKCRKKGRLVQSAMALQRALRLLGKNRMELRLRRAAQLFDLLFCTESILI